MGFSLKGGDRAGTMHMDLLIDFRFGFVQDALKPTCGSLSDAWYENSHTTEKRKNNDERREHQYTLTEDSGMGKTWSSATFFGTLRGKLADKIEEWRKN